MKYLWFDTETYSECDLRKHGTPVYAAHPSTEITVAQWAVDDGEPQVADLTDAGNGANFAPAALHPLLLDPDVVVVAHNSFFDRTLIRECWGIDVPAERWLDTMIVAYEHALPGALGALGDALGVREDAAKDKRGRALIQLFCKPRPANSKLRRATRETHPAEWAEFLEYSRQDIVAMRAVTQRMPDWNFRVGSPEHRLWVLDQRINDRGFAVDTELVAAAIGAIKDAQAGLKAQTAEATEGVVTSPSKRDQLLNFILAEHGVDLPDLRADTVRRRLEDPELPDGVKLLLMLRSEASKTSTSKYAAFANMTSADGRMRATMQFAGASRTARWAHRGPQPGNMPRPSHGFTQPLQETTIGALKAGAAHLAGDVMQMTADAVRGCIVAPPGRKLCVADLSNIEGRGLVYLSGEQWKLDAFAALDRGEGHDLYKLAFARSFGVDPAKVSKADRQIGKVQELALGYEGGVGAFLTFAAVYQMDLAKMADAVHASAGKDVLAAAYRMHEWTVEQRRTTHGLEKNVWVACEALKAMWRSAHPATQAFWKDIAQAARDAIATPGVAFPAGKHIKLRRDGAWLRLRLPSGRFLCYLNPRVDDAGQISYMGVNQYTRKWARIKTYGGKLAENATQAFARDVLASSMQAAEDRGYAIVLSVHDELLAETPDSDAYTHTELAGIMATVPGWAKGLPLAAAGFEAKRYGKFD